MRYRKTWEPERQVIQKDKRYRNTGDTERLRDKEWREVRKTKIQKEKRYEKTGDKRQEIEQTKQKLV